MDKLCMNVDGTGYRDLTPYERKVLEIALSQYHIKKSSERMLEAHKQPNADAMKPVFAKYDKVLRAIKALQEATA